MCSTCAQSARQIGKQWGKTGFLKGYIWIEETTDVIGNFSLSLCFLLSKLISCSNVFIGSMHHGLRYRNIDIIFFTDNYIAALGVREDASRNRPKDKGSHNG
jgi:hypothetical protein